MRRGDGDEMTEEQPTIEQAPYALLDVDGDPDKALRLWIFDVIHSNEYVNLHKTTLDYCQSAFEWLKGKPAAAPPEAGSNVIPFPHHFLSGEKLKSAA